MTGTMTRTALARLNFEDSTVAIEDDGFTVASFTVEHLGPTFTWRRDWLAAAIGKLHDLGWIPAGETVESGEWWWVRPVRRDPFTAQMEASGLTQLREALTGRGVKSHKWILPDGRPAVLVQSAGGRPLREMRPDDQLWQVTGCCVAGRYKLALYPWSVWCAQGEPATSTCVLPLESVLEQVSR